MTEMLPSEEALVERARGGHRSAQQTLWRDHRRWVAAIILAHRPRSIEVDDLMQDVAIKFISKIETLRDAGAFRPWLRQIAINICRGAARGHRPDLRLADEARPGRNDAGLPAGPRVPADAGPSSDDSVATRESASVVLARVQGLPAEYREPLLLRCVRGLTYQQIGDVLDLPVTTIETRLARARRMLREECAADHAGGAQDDR